MSVERIIGIDFGTSTSVIKVKTYKDNQPLVSINAVDYVHFDNKDVLPTLVYKTTEGKYLIGYEAENAAVKGILYSNFKLNLISSDEALRAEAVTYTELFFNYMFEAYNNQISHFPACDIETTYVSYPAKWPDALRDVMTGIARKAGFKNVKGLDEPTAAIHTVMVHESEKLVLGGQDSLNILMIDMGAGTTDLVLCKYTPYEEKHINILNTWPKSDSQCLFGGREVDEALCDYIKAYLNECGLPNTKNFNEKYLDKCKKWKETNLSPIFKDKNGVVKYCGFIDTLLAMLGVDKDFPPLSRSNFEDMLSHYLSQFPNLVNDCLNHAGFNAENLDYVILTGGHSQWYFSDEMLNGTLTRFGVPNLPQMKGSGDRIIKLSRPQETVALGLVYQRIAIKKQDRPSIKVTGIINLIADRTVRKTGVDLLSDSVALKRLEEAAKKAVAELVNAESATIDIPYISANSRGPVHLKETISRSELTSFILRYQNNQASDEKLCKQCSRKISKSAKFCGYCGYKDTPAESIQGRAIPVIPLQTPEKQKEASNDTGAQPRLEKFCGKCGKKIPVSAEFCGYCGFSMKPGTAAKFNLVVARDSQFVCAGVLYQVIVDGVNHGTLLIGQSKTVTVSKPVTIVEIVCTTVLMKHNIVKMKLHLVKNPRVNFKVNQNGQIIPAVSGADIIEYIK